MWLSYLAVDLKDPPTIKKLVDCRQYFLNSYITLRALTLSLMIALATQTLAQDTDGTSRLIEQLESGKLFGRIIERTPGSYVVVPESQNLPAVRVLNPERVSPASVGVNLLLDATYETEEKGIRLNDYDLSTLTPETVDNQTRGSTGIAMAIRPPGPVTRALTTFRGEINDALQPGAMPAEGIRPDRDSSVTRAAREVESELNQLYTDAVEQGDAGLANRNAAVRGLAEVRQELKSIYGTIDNYPPWSYERISRNAKSVVAIAEPGQTRQALCSGVLIANDLVLTAGHCFRNHHPEDLEVWFGFAESADQTPLNPVSKTIVELVAPPHSLHDDFLDRAAHDGFDATMPDFAIVRFDSTGDQAEIEALSPQCLRSNHIRRDKAIYVIGYPKGTRETVHDNARIYLPFRLRPRDFEKLKQDIEVDFVLLEEQERISLMADFVASYKPRGEGSDKVFELYDTRWGSQPKVGIVADLFRGNSGSPVFDRNNHCIVGIHTGGVSDTGLRLGATWQTHETVLPIPAIIDQLKQHADTLPLVESGTLDLQ